MLNLVHSPTKYPGETFWNGWFVNYLSRGCWQLINGCMCVRSISKPDRCLPCFHRWPIQWVYTLQKGGSQISHPVYTYITKGSLGLLVRTPFTIFIEAKANDGVLTCNQGDHTRCPKPSWVQESWMLHNHTEMWWSGIIAHKTHR